MTNPLTEVTPFVYTNPQGLQLEVLFVLDPEKKGYINATAIAKQFGKEPKDWLKNQNICDYITALIDKMNFNINNCSVNSSNYSNSLNLFRSGNYPNETKSITYDDLVISIQGGPPEKQGTWLHPKLAVVFARWMSAHFAVWCDELIAGLLNQYPIIHQQQFYNFAVILNKLEENQRQFRQESNQRFQVLEQRFEESINTTAQMLNHWQAKTAQDHKHSLGQIFNGINQLNKTLSQQQQADLLKPPVEVGIKQTLLEYQHSLEQMLQQMLHGQQDELIQNYLLAIKENLERIVQRFVNEPVPSITPTITLQTIEPANLVMEITALKAQGWSWQLIAQELNARGTATVSGTGQWHGSSVKRYVESHAAG